MVNVDCKIEIRGQCITALDFAKMSNIGIDYDSQKYINRLLFIGDKCHLIGFIDNTHNIFLNCKTLNSVYNNVTKEKFTEIILKIFNIINRSLVPYMNCCVSQFIEDKIQNVVIKSILNKIKGGLIHDCEYVPIIECDFTSDGDIQKYIIGNIRNEIKKIISQIVSESFILHEFKITDVLNSVRDMYTSYINTSNEKSFKNGLILYDVIRNTDWNFVESVIDDVNYHKIHLNPNHLYIYKDISLTPKYAILNPSDCYDGISTYRRLKDDPKIISEVKNIIHIDRLYIDITTGEMYASGRHPNVSSGYKVCMGDLAGKLTFCNMEVTQIKDMIKQCEELLEVVNYTSSYSNEGKYYFKEPKSSEDVAMDNCTKQDVATNRKLIEDAQSIGDDDFELDGDEIVDVNNDELLQDDDFECD
jgi:hypothetical protein